MRHPITALLAAAVLSLAACGGAAAPSPSPSASRTPAPTPTPVAQVVFTADLKATNEVPPVANDEKNANGSVTVTLDLTRDTAGKVTAASAKFDFTVKGLLATTEIVAAHIHKGPATVAAPPVTDSLVKAGDVKVVVDTVTVTGVTITIKPETAEDILSNPSGFYFNAHSRLNSGGVARGQLTKKA